MSRCSIKPEQRRHRKCKSEEGQLEVFQIRVAPSIKKLLKKIPLDDIRECLGRFVVEWRKK